MDPRPTTQVEVLERVVARLLDRLPDVLTASTCILTARPPREVPGAVRSNVFVTVSPTDGQFDVSIQVGAGDRDVREQAGVIVVVWSAVRLDQAGHDTALLMDASRGLLTIKGRILAALAGHMLLDENGVPILTAHMYAERSESPQGGADAKDRRVTGDLAVILSTDFEWNLT